SDVCSSDLPVDLRLAYPVTQRLPVDTQPVRHPGDRPLLLPGLLPDLEHHPHGPLTDLIRVLLRCWHDSHLRKVGSLQRTRGGSAAAALDIMRLRMRELTPLHDGPGSKATRLQILVDIRCGRQARCRHQPRVTQRRRPAVGLALLSSASPCLAAWERDAPVN